MTPCILCHREAVHSCAVCGLHFCSRCFAGEDHIAAHSPHPADAPATLDAGAARLRTIREALAACELAASLLRAVVRSAPGGGR